MDPDPANERRARAAAQRAARGPGCPRPSSAAAQPRVGADLLSCCHLLPHRHLGLMTNTDRGDVHWASLADAIHAPDALFQAHRCPRQIEVHHPARAMLQVETLTGDVRGEKRIGVAVEKPR